MERTGEVLRGVEEFSSFMCNKIRFSALKILLNIAFTIGLLGIASFITFFIVIAISERPLPYYCEYKVFTIQNIELGYYHDHSTDEKVPCPDKELNGFLLKFGYSRIIVD